MSPIRVSLSLTVTAWCETKNGATKGAALLVPSLGLDSDPLRCFPCLHIHPPHIYGATTEAQVNMEMARKIHSLLSRG